MIRDEREEVWLPKSRMKMKRFKEGGKGRKGGKGGK